MEDFEEYLLVGMLRSVVSSDTTHKAFTAEELSSLLQQTYGVEYSALELRPILLKAIDQAGISDLIDHVISQYASERFIIKVKEAREVAKITDTVEVWDNCRKIGDAWLKEALINIRSQIDAGDLTVDGVVQERQLEYKSVPASDRYVSPLDNQSAFEEVSTQLAAVREDVASSNSIEEEERLIALSEIALFEAAICQPRLAHEIIERFLAFCSARLSQWVGGAAVGYLIDKLKALIEHFVSSLP